MPPLLSVDSMYSKSLRKSDAEQHGLFFSWLGQNIHFIQKESPKDKRKSFSQMAPLIRALSMFKQTEYTMFMDFQSTHKISTAKGVKIAMPTEHHKLLSKRFQHILPINLIPRIITFLLFLYGCIYGLILGKEVIGI